MIQRRTSFILALTISVASAVVADDDAAHQKQYEQAVAKAVSYLKAKGQASDGSFSNHAGIGPTALVTTALLRHGVPTSDPSVAKSLQYLEDFIQPDGGIYSPGTFYRNYETCLTVLCFTEANKDGRYDKAIQRADAFVKGIQWDEDEGKDPSDLAYGGGGYGKHKRPDLSNTSFLIDALRAAGNSADSEAIQRALVFVSRCQNLETEHNTTAFPVKNPDGGFYYTAAAGGSSQAGETANGGLRSYGSMTYAGLKSMLYAGVSRDDPRVQAAAKWASDHYDLKANPGLGTAGLFYYYHLFGKALDAIGEDTFIDANGRKHDWRAELVAELAARQQPDGSWINDNDRWFEGDANLVTGYALLGLAYCKPATAE
ncbi:MAG: terpene cyclase/mutase family protein [Planctomycetaceae bacterium]|nr:terpene cyclase/mutase family protein [Planctomycetaceae bacterium]